MWDFCPQCGLENRLGPLMETHVHTFDYSSGPYCVYCGMLGNVNKVKRYRTGEMVSGLSAIFFVGILVYLEVTHHSSVPDRWEVYGLLASLGFCFGYVGLLIRKGVRSDGRERHLPPERFAQDNAYAQSNVRPPTVIPFRYSDGNEGCGSYLATHAAFVCTCIGIMIIMFAKDVEYKVFGWLVTVSCAVWFIKLALEPPDDW